MCGPGLLPEEPIRADVVWRGVQQLEKETCNFVGGVRHEHEHCMRLKAIADETSGEALQLQQGGSCRDSCGKPQSQD